MSIGAKPWEGAGGAASVPDASETTKGKIRIATSAEATTGTDDLTAMTPLTVKERIDAAITGGIEYKGTFDASTGLPSLANAEQGDLYKISTAGTIYGRDWAVGDHLIINEDMGGTISNGKIDKVDNTESPASETVAGVIEIATNAEATAASATDKALVPSNISSIDLSSFDNDLSADDFAADHTASNYTPSNANIDGHLSGIDSALASAGGNQITLIDTKSIDFTAASNAIYDIQSSLTVTMPGSPSEGDLIGFAAQGTATPSLTVSGTLETVNNVQTTSTTIEVNKRVVVWWGYNGARWQQLNDSLKVATASLAGVLETASNAEATAASATDRALTPSNIGSINVGDLNDDSTYQPLDAQLTDVAGLTPADGAFIVGDGANFVAESGATARTSLGLTIGTDVQAHDAQLDDVAGLTPADGAVIIGDGANFVTESGSTARASLGLTIGTDVQAYDAQLADVAGLTPADGAFIVGDGANFVTETLATARTSLGLGTAATSDTGDFLASTSGLDDLSDVAYTAGAGIDNYVLTYDHSTTSWGAEAVPSAASASETVAGVIEIATNAEAAAGTATDKALVPSNISSVDLSQADNTTSGFISGITGENLNDLSDVSFTAGAGIDNYVLTYDNSTTSWGAEAAPTASAASETVAGVIEIATNAEAAAGTATDKALVPSNISSVDLSQADNTTSGFISGITGESLNDLSDVSYTAGAGIDNYVLTYDHSTTSWGAEAAAGGGLSAVVDDTTPQLGGALDVNGNAITSASNGNVTINPDGTGDISVGADIIPDADATHTIGDEDNRFISLYSDVNGALRFKAKNDEGAQITKGQVVYIKGIAGDGETPTVGLADSDDASKMPAFGLAFNTANDQAEIQIVFSGNLYGLNTSGFSVGDTLFVGTSAGGLTETKPTGETAQLQNIGRVIRSNNGAGVIMVGGAGRSAATPNLDQDKIFLGNASNQAVSTALSAINLTSFNDDLGSTYQPLDTGLTSIAGLTTSANQMLYTTGSDAYDVTSITAAGRAILDDADAAAQRTTLGLVIGTDVLGEVADDSTPQLGGDLDLNGQDITTTSNANLGLKPHGTGFTELIGNTTGGNNPGSIRFNCEQNTHGVIVKSPLHGDYDSAGDYTLTLPTGLPDSDKVLQSTSAGVLSWVDQSGGGGGGFTYSAVSTATTAQAQYHYSVTGTTTITLPAATGVTAGQEVRVKVMGTDTVTVSRSSTDTIDGETSITMAVQYQALNFISNGSNGWEII